MLRLKMRTDIKDRQPGSLLQKSMAAGMPYQTFHRMATKGWNARALELLARFLGACGFTADEINHGYVSFGDIFEATEDGRDGRDEKRL